MVSGSEELSPADSDSRPNSSLTRGKLSSSQRKSLALYGSLGPSKGVRGVLSTASIPRPKILNKRRTDRSQQDDAWSQRCVDVFDIIAQIGEGTYGHVYKARPKDSGELLHPSPQAHDIIRKVRFIWRLFFVHIQTTLYFVLLLIIILKFNLPLLKSKITFQTEVHK